MAERDDAHSINIQQHLEALEGRKTEAPKAEAPKVELLATHKIGDQETLSDLSLKYYGHATEPYWRLIYEANKEAIGPNPNQVHPGTELKIPVLPETMKAP